MSAAVTLVAEVVSEPAPHGATTHPLVVKAQANYVEARVAELTHWRLYVAACERRDDKEADRLDRLRDRLSQTAHDARERVDHAIGVAMGMWNDKGERVRA